MTSHARRRVSRLAHLACLAALAHGALGCGSARPLVKPVSQAAWTDARSALAKMRDEVPDAPYVEIIRVALREPRTGRVLEGRGAVAVDPHRAMRMVLLGPGGRTALDVWVTKDSWRFSIPAIDVTRRGSAGQVTYDLPIGFFRWWFLETLDGRLLTAQADERGRTYVLREKDATVTLRELAAVAGEGAGRRAREPSSTTDRVAARALEGAAPHIHRRHFVALRRDKDTVDRLEWVARSIRPGPGDRARYLQRVTGLEVEILVEAISHDPPDPAAFLDPDDLGTSL